MQVDADDPTFSAAVARHCSVLERQPARHNLILGFLTRVPQMPVEDVHFWSFETAGSCALQVGKGSIVLGELVRDDEAALAGLVAGLPFHGIFGPDDAALRLVKRCEDLGIGFEASQALAIHELDRPPRFPGSPGWAREVGAEDEVVFSAFMGAFLCEAAPHHPVPSAERIAADARSGRYLFWTVDDAPVSVAGKVRETATLAAISGVYTPPEHRGRGYAGSVTTALCERLFAEGKRVICLFADFANPYSNRCYAKIGFERVGTAYHCFRKQT
jgi:RimJ/RimL family protein N-acetyltransferase